MTLRRVALRLPAKPAPLPGGVTVYRALPRRECRAVGPFVFLDHAGPQRYAPGAGMYVPPHPHAGLETVTWLFDGALLHKDSLGNAQALLPGDLNWMTAGRGIVHSEESEPGFKRRGGDLHLVQIWVALPAAARARALRVARRDRARRRRAGARDPHRRRAARRAACDLGQLRARHGGGGEAGAGRLRGRPLRRRAMNDAGRFAAGECLRCGARLGGEYCAACGQRRARRLALGRVLRESAARLADLDNRVWRTLRVLFTRPGTVARRYAAGDRDGWTNPFLLLIAVATAFVFVVHARDLQLRTPWGPPPPELQGLANLALSATAYLMFVIFLPVAWLQSRLFRAEGANAAECYVFLLYWYALHLAFTTLGALAGLLHIVQGGWLSVLSAGLLLWCLSGFYGSFGPRLAMKGLLVYAGYFLTFAALGVTLFTLGRRLGVG